MGYNMDGKREQGKTMSRRSFIACGATAGMLGVAASGLTKAFASEPASADSGEADESYDVVVVGGGAAGTSAAIEAYESGMSVILLEKEGAIGGDTAISGQMYCVRDESQISAEDFVKSVKEAMTPVSRMTCDGVDAPLYGDDSFLLQFAEKNPEVFSKLQGYGIVFAPFDVVMPQGSFTMVTEGRLMPRMGDLLDERGIEARTDSPVYQLMQDGDGKVTGVVALVDEKPCRIKANKGVILACGSPCGNRSLVARYLPDYSFCQPGGAEGNSGDGHELALQAGGCFRGMDIGLQFMPYDYPSNLQLYFTYGISGTGSNGMMVNISGKRFVDETYDYSNISREIWRQPSHVGYFVMDAPIAETFFGISADSAAEYYDQVKELPYIGQTVEELAGKLGVDADTFSSEVDRYNGFVQAGKDDDFGKAITDVCAPLSTAPFFAVSITPKMYFMYGGVTVDTGMRVLDADGQAIPGLYSAGSINGDFPELSGVGYCGGILQGLTWGMVAAQSIVADAQ